MVKVATNLDVPIKLLWTKSLTFNTERGFTMLGLGDVVIPGLFVSLALRYDHHRSSQKSTDGKFDKPYFFAALLGYTVGLGTTMFVMHTFKAAQPALLYLRSVYYFTVQLACTHMEFRISQSRLHLVVFAHSGSTRRAAGRMDMERRTTESKHHRISRACQERGCQGSF